MFYSYFRTKNNARNTPLAPLKGGISTGDESVNAKDKIMHTLPENRLVSLDVFRGLTIAAMILVNNPGSWSYVYPPLEHAEWHGWTPTDFIFPFFLFIVGVAMAFSFGKYLQGESIPKSLYLKIIRRTLTLFGLGLFLHLIPTDALAGYNWLTNTLAKVRIMGVLQRIAVVYFFAAMTALHFKLRGQAFWGIGLLAFYWIIMKLVPVPVMENGAVVTHIGSLSKDINLAAYVDTLVLHGHTWQVGKYFDYDPEGILSTIPAIATTLIGIFTGYWLKSGKLQNTIALGLFAAGVGGLLLGALMNYGFPINKPLWSPSYVVFMGGMALVFLAACYYLIDIKAYSWWTKPFVIFGMNAIALYVLAGIFTRITLLIKVNADDLSVKGWFYDAIFQPLFGNMNGSLAFALIYVFIWLGIMSIFYQKRIFIKV